MIKDNTDTISGQESDKWEKNLNLLIMVRTIQTVRKGNTK